MADRATTQGSPAPAAPEGTSGQATVSDQAGHRRRVAIITNGNYFSNLALRHLLETTAPAVDYRVIVTTGLRRQSGNRAVETVALLRRWGIRYFAYKFVTYALPALAQLLTGQPRFVARTCQLAGIPVEHVRNVNHDEPANSLRSFSPDIIVSFSCPYRIKNHVLDIPTVGSLNVHSSLLPRYAGVCTYVHVLADGESRTGVTVHEMTEQFDAGRIVAQQPIDIARRTSVFDLFSRQCRAAGPMLVEAITACLDDGRVGGVAQDASQRTYSREPTRHDIAKLRAHGHRLIRPADCLGVLDTSPSSYARAG